MDTSEAPLGVGFWVTNSEECGAAGYVCVAQWGAVCLSSVSVAVGEDVRPLRELERAVHLPVSRSRFSSLFLSFEMEAITLEIQCFKDDESLASERLAGR